MAYSKDEIETIFNSICERIERGEFARVILKENNMPSSRTFFKWLDEDEDKVKRYARATEIRAEGIFEEMVEIADDSTNDYMMKKVGNEIVEVVNSEHIQRSRLRIDTRKWILAKMNPKRFSDKLDITSDNKPIVNSVIQVEIVKPIEDED